MLGCETKFKQFRDTKSNTVNEEDIIKNIVQILYDEVLFDNFPEKDQVFESYMKNKEFYVIKEYGKEIVIDGNIYQLSDLEYETQRETIIQRKI